MNYIGRKDNGRYISSEKGGAEITKRQGCLVAPIHYDKEIAENAAKLKVKYRDLVTAATLDTNGFDGTDYLKQRKDGQSKVEQ